MLVLLSYRITSFARLAEKNFQPKVAERTIFICIAFYINMEYRQIFARNWFAKDPDVYIDIFHFIRFHCFEITEVKWITHEGYVIEAITI